MIREGCRLDSKLAGQGDDLVQARVGPACLDLDQPAFGLADPLGQNLLGDPSSTAMAGDVLANRDGVGI